MTLQQILALKYLGFTLDEIRRCLQREPGEIGTILARQSEMLRDRRRQLDAILAAIERVTRKLDAGTPAAIDIAGVIEVIQMEQKQEWVRKHFTSEQLDQMEQLRQSSYSESARQKLAARGEWTEADQEQASAQWAHVASESKRLAAAGADPAGPEAQAVAKLKHDLLFAFTQGDPEITEGLSRFWQNHGALPADRQPLTSTVPETIRPGGADDGARFLERAMEAYRDANATASS